MRSCQTCGRALTTDQRTFCSHRCVAIATRAKQTPERRRQIAREARARQEADVKARLLARVKVAADRDDDRILLAFRLGLAAGKSGRWRQIRKHALLAQAIHAQP